jgi:hypothetical protein
MGSTRLPVENFMQVAAPLTQLVSIEVAHVEMPSADRTGEDGWNVPAFAPFQHLLSKCSLLSTLSMEMVVLHQDGLDLLLAHPHVTDVTLMAVSATESRVDSPCAWRALRLAQQVPIGTVAYVPLHSLKQPLPVEALLLPPDAIGRSSHLPDVLLAATTRMAQHSHLFKLKDPCELIITDAVWELPSGESMAPRCYTLEDDVFRSKGYVPVYECTLGNREALRIPGI